MAAVSTKRWSANKWVENEIDDVADCYGNTRLQAATHVLDLLHEGEYRDELTDDQVQAAIPVARGEMLKEVRHED